MNISDAFHAELTMFSVSAGKTISQVVREAIREKIDREAFGADLTPYDFEWHIRFNPDVLQRPLEDRVAWAVAHQRTFERDHPRQPQPKKEAA